MRHKINNRGITLLEVLIAITIIALISTISMPIINNVIVDARKNTFVDTAYGLIDAARQYHTNAVLNKTGRTLSVNYTTSSNTKKLKVSGKLPDAGNLTMDKEGNVALALWSNSANTCVTKTASESKVVISAKTKAQCHL